MVENGKQLVNVDELRKELGFSDTCDNCERATSNCASDNGYSLYDFFVRLDCAIEAILERIDITQCGHIVERRRLIYVR